MIMIILLVTIIVIACITTLGTAMIKNHFKQIEKSLEVFIDTKAYKPQRQIIFISSVLEKLRKSAEEEDDEDVKTVI
ncbi:MAG: hypothetical protein ACRCSG_00400, partial [Cellulosilyticaceae bacterium]